MSAQDDTTTRGPVNYQDQCPHCNAITVIPADAEFTYEDDYCASCGESFYTSPEVEDEPADEPVYFRHKVYSREGGINRALCGHTRTTEESDSIIAALGERWNTCPPCEPCASMVQAEREIKRSRERERKALQLARYILKSLDERGLEL